MVLPPPGGGAMGVGASSGLMSAINLATAFCGADTLGSTRASISVLAGIPRSARLMFADSGEFTSQLMNFTAASGFLVRADAENNCDALYHAFRSRALPVRLGIRRITRSLPAA